MDKLLQIILAFVSGGTQAYQKKSNLLKVNTDQYKTVMNFIKNNNVVTTNAILNLYLLYLKMDKKKKDSDAGTFPIPYYGLDCFNKYDCRGDFSQILTRLDSKEKVDRLFKMYYMTTYKYTSYYTKNNNVSYNNMIKQNIEYEKLEECYHDSEEMLELTKV